MSDYSWSENRGAGHFPLTRSWRFPLKRSRRFPYAVAPHVANRMVTRVGMLAHNLGREMQMRTRAVDHHKPTPKRTARWRFQSLGTIANTLIHRAGRFVRPQGNLTLRMNANPTAQKAYREVLDGLAA